MEVSRVQKASNKELNMNDTVSDTPFPGRAMVLDRCYKTVKAPRSCGLRVNDHFLSSMLYFLRENALGTI